MALDRIIPIEEIERLINKQEVVDAFSAFDLIGRMVENDKSL